MLTLREFIHPNTKERVSLVKVGGETHAKPYVLLYVDQKALESVPIDSFARLAAADERFNEFMVDNFSFELIEGSTPGEFHLSHPQYGLVKPANYQWVAQEANLDFASW